MPDMNQNTPNNQNTQFNQRSQVTTGILNLWDSNSKQLKVSGLDHGMTIAMWIPEYNPDGSHKYPQEQRYNMVLSQKNVMALEKIITGVILPAYEKTVNAKAGVFTNNAESNMVELEVKDGRFYLNFYRGCDPSTRVANQKFQFQFESTMIVKNYNTETGELEAEPVEADFGLFVACIRGYNEESAGLTSGHGGRITNQYRWQQLFDHIKAIANATHAQVPVYNRGGYQNSGNSYGNNGYNRPSQPPQDYSQMPTIETVDDGDLPI